MSKSKLISELLDDKIERPNSIDRTRSNTSKTNKESEVPKTRSLERRNSKLILGENGKITLSDIDFSSIRRSEKRSSKLVVMENEKNIFERFRKSFKIRKKTFQKIN